MQGQPPFGHPPATGGFQQRPPMQGQVPTGAPPQWSQQRGHPPVGAPPPRGAPPMRGQPPPMATGARPPNRPPGPPAQFRPPTQAPFTQPPPGSRPPPMGAPRGAPPPSRPGQPPAGRPAGQPPPMRPPMGGAPPMGGPPRGAPPTGPPRGQPIARPPMGQGPPRGAPPAGQQRGLPPPVRQQVPPRGAPPLAGQQPPPMHQPPTGQPPAVGGPPLRRVYPGQSRGGVAPAGPPAGVPPGAGFVPQSGAGGPAGAPGGAKRSAMARPQPGAGSTPTQFSFSGRDQNASSMPRPPYHNHEVLPDDAVLCDYKHLNAHPKYMRFTTNVVPHTSALAAKAQVPLGMLLTPYGDAPDGKDPVPVVSFGNHGIVRCRRCRTYINPFVTFIDGGRRWRCNTCSLPNDVPGEYYCQLDSSGRRNDHASRPELTNGSVEYIAPQEYMVRPPQPPVYMFLIDVSYHAVASGMLHTVATTIRESLDELPGGGRTKFGLITYDSTVHFYHLKASLNQPQMIVVPDVDDVYAPMPSDLVVNLRECRTIIDSLLERLPSMFENNQVTDSALGAAVQATYQMIEHVGGKVLIFQSALPSVGPGKLKAREDYKLIGTDKETSLLQPGDKWYKTIAVDASRVQISFDVSCCAPTYCDLATLSELAKHSAGNLYHYPAFDSKKHGSQLAVDLRRNLTRKTGFEAVMRIRCSKGVKVSLFHGHYFVRSSDLLALPNIDADKSFGVQLTVDEDISKSKFVSFQAALLYTTSGGERRIRVHTAALPVTRQIGDIFAKADVVATSSMLCKMAIDKALNSKISDARTALINKCTDIVSTYRAAFAGATGALNLPESLKLLPLYTLVMLKSIQFKTGSDFRLDERAFALANGKLMHAADMSFAFYPRLFRLYPAANMPNDGRLPPVISLSSDKLARDAVLLLDDGRELLLWLGKDVPSNVLNSLFGTDVVSSAAGVDLVPFGKSNDPLLEQVHGVLAELRRQHYKAAMPLRILVDGAAQHKKFANRLVEDRTKTVMSYYEFLDHLRKGKK